MKSIDFLYLGFLILAVVMMYYSFFFYTKTTNLLGKGITTKATVKEHIRVYDSDGDTFKASLDYQDKQGEFHNYVTNYSSRPAPFKIGQKVEIVYNNDHSEVAIVSYWGLYWKTVVLLSIALPLLVIAIGYFLYAQGSSIRII